jgi:hypothetical protein
MCSLSPAGPTAFPPQEFAWTLDWPGWCRRARGRADSLQALRDYAPRYLRAVHIPGPGGELEVLGGVVGKATTEFGAPGTPTPWDGEPPPFQERTRLPTVAGAAPAALRRLAEGRPRRPVAYGTRRCAWHVFDDAFEVEDQSG